MLATTQLANAEVLPLICRPVSTEIVPELAASFPEPSPQFPPESLVFLPHIAGKPLATQQEAGQIIRDKGYTPVAHLAARVFESREELHSQVEALAGVGVEHYLVLGGNPGPDERPLPNAEAILADQVMADVKPRHLFIGGHPEGHPDIPGQALMPALHRKIALIDEMGVAVSIVTQFGFDGDVMADWIEEVRAEGLDVPIRIGVAGVTSLPKLIKFAMFCGVGNSVKALQKTKGSVLKALRDQDPGDVVAALDRRLAVHGSGDVALHFFPFGGWPKTLDWVSSARPR